MPFEVPTTPVAIKLSAHVPGNARVFGPLHPCASLEETPSLWFQLGSILVIVATWLQ